MLTDPFERVRGRYEDDFEREHGRWRGVVDAVVGRYLDCGVLEAGFVRVRCEDCRAEYLLALSCKTRWLDQDDAAAHERLARYCARCPVSLERLEYDAETGTVTYTSDKADGPTAGRHTFEVTDFIARLVAHIPDKGQVLQRYYGYYANRARGERRKAARAPEAEPAAAEIDAATSRGPKLALAEAVIGESANFSRADARRWAVLIRRIYEVDPLVCPKCAGTMRMIALIQEPKVIDKILKHLRTKGRDARAGPWATGLSPPADAAAEAA